MKATVKPSAGANLKPTDGIGQVISLTGGMYVFGDLNTAKTDVINIMGYYTASGIKTILSKPHKVFVGSNLVVTDEVEPNPNDDPDPTPAPIVYPPVSYSFDFNDPKTLTIFSDVEFEMIIYNGSVLKDASEG